ncbi:MAG: YfhO family protein, partial [Clostridiales bacterium]|nr:YfhO family protein [Clostridiales bacterium]
MKKLVQNQVVRYAFFGGCTTAVNLVAYYLLCAAGINITVANTIAVMIAIVFAYVVNKLFVFEHRTNTFAEFCKEAGSFIGMRLGTMVVEVFGVLCLVCIWGMPNLAAKLLIQVVIVVLNYFISKFVVFKEDSPNGPREAEKSCTERSEAERSESESPKAEKVEKMGTERSQIMRPESEMPGDTQNPDEQVPGRRRGRLHTGKKTAHRQASAKQISRYYFLAGFALSALIAGVGFALIGVWPFGDKTLLIIDSLHQYLPCYTDLHEIRVNSDSFLYSFSGGLGYNFWSTYAYYMASPLNFLMAFIPTAHVCDFMDLMILLKIALCGGCFSWYMHKRDEDRNYLPIVFGMMYALSNFVIGYYFNLMWLDSIAMLPLIMYGIEQIVKGKRGKFYCLSLFYGLWCNYYIGFMLCIFSCLYFLVRWIAQTAEYGGTADVGEQTPEFAGSGESSGRRGVFHRFTARIRRRPEQSASWQNLPRDLGKSCLTFAWSSLLAGGMAALVLVPAFMGLTASESMESNTFPTVVKFYESLAELLENHMAFMEPVTISSSQVGLNVYCGVAAVLLAVLYLFDHEISLRERLSHYGLCAFLLFSFACNIPNYIWHGFHTQNGLPNRFAFIYIAVLLVMAYDALGHLKNFLLPELLAPVAIQAACKIVRSLEPDQELEGYLVL